MISSNTEVLKTRLNEIEHYTPFMDTLNPSVSKASVAWHLDHSLKVINGVIKTMQTSDPSAFKNDFNYLGKIILAFGFIPRGKGRSPKAVRPPEHIIEEDLKTQLKEAKFNIEVIQGLDVNAHFKHPYFGALNKTKVTRFLEVHTKHHLKIIKDIVAK